MTDILLCEVLRGQREIDRLLLEMALEPELAAAIARCPRPYIDSKPFQEQGTTTFPVLTIRLSRSRNRRYSARSTLGLVLPAISGGLFWPVSAVSRWRVHLHSRRSQSSGL